MNIFNCRTNELNEMTKFKEMMESNLKMNEDKIRCLSEEKFNLELKLKEQMAKFNNLTMDHDNYSMLIQQNTKTNAMLKV